MKGFAGMESVKMKNRVDWEDGDYVQLNCRHEKTGMQWCHTILRHTADNVKQTIENKWPDVKCTVVSNEEKLRLRRGVRTVLDEDGWEARPKYRKRG